MCTLLILHTEIILIYYSIYLFIYLTFKFLIHHIIY